PARALHSFPTRRSSDLTGGEVCPRRTPDGAVAAAAATQAESSKLPVFHPSGSFRASYASIPWSSVEVVGPAITFQVGSLTTSIEDRKSTRLNSSHVAIS